MGLWSEAPQGPPRHLRKAHERLMSLWVWASGKWEELPSRLRTAVETLYCSIQKLKLRSRS
ncbi:MAG: hypothetical protein B6A08_02665 [Sorangiineae bacterium NIC37A_2]|jgi:hypothetical protein|nr:MAG: hypothetical protein B6A08_02665 [Sorangiineae bacterium NIC37A_2]